jgi:hypothetical protein
MKFNLEPNDPDLNWNIALLIFSIILLFIMFNYGIVLNNNINKINTGEFLTNTE